MTTAFLDLAASPLVERLGWTLIHFLWQATLVAAAVAVLLRLSHKASPNARYIGLCVGLVTIAIAPVVTFVALAGEQTISARGRHEPPASEHYQTSMAVGVELEAHEAIPLPALGNRHFTSLWLTTQLKQSMPWVVFGWTIGVGLLSVWHLAGWLLAHRLTTQGTQPVSEATQSMLHSLMQRMKIPASVRLLESTATSVPIVVGWLKPVLLMPASLLSGLPPDQIRAILAHELAHIRRHDFLVNLLQTVVETCLFYHPAVWWLSRQIRIEREYCADAEAVAVCEDRDVYAKALVSLAAFVMTVPSPAVAATGGSLSRRIHRVLGLTAGRDPLVRQPSWLVSAAVGLTLVGALIQSGALVAKPTSNADPDQAAKDQAAKDQADPETLPIKAMAEKMGSVIKGWTLKEYDKQPSIGGRGYRVVLRRDWKEYIGPITQQVQAKHEEKDLVSKHEDWEFALFPGPLKLSSEELMKMVKWRESDSPYYTRDIWLGNGHGYEWFTRGTLFGQEQARDNLNLKGGQDRIQLAIDGFEVKDPGTNTANSCLYVPAKFGDKAIPYIRKAVQERQSSEGEWRVILSLAFIQTDAATDYLLELYNSDDSELRRAAEYALIHKPFRKAAKEAYLDMLKRQSSYDGACQASVEFQWVEAIPILKNMIAKPPNLYSLPTLITSRRALEGKPIKKELLDSLDTLRKSGWIDRPPELNQQLVDARKLLIETDDAEAANMIAFALAVATSKGGATPQNEAGLAVLKQRPRESTLNFLKSIANGIQEGDYPRVAKVLEIVTASPEP